MEHGCADIPCQGPRLLSTMQRDYRFADWVEYKECGAFCCTSCVDSDVLLAEASGCAYLKPQKLQTPFGFIVCALSRKRLPNFKERHPFAPNVSSVRRPLHNRSDACCTDVPTVVLSMKQRTQAKLERQMGLKGQAIPKKDEPRPLLDAFVHRSESSAAAAKTVPAEWPRLRDERACQDQCVRVKCALYTYYNLAAHDEVWKKRCVTWSAETAWKAQRIDPSTWVTELYTFSAWRTEAFHTPLLLAHVEKKDGATDLAEARIEICGSEDNCDCSVSLAPGMCLDPELGCWGHKSFFGGTPCAPTDGVPKIRGVRVRGEALEIHSLSISWNGQFQVKFASEEDANVLVDGFQSLCVVQPGGSARPHMACESSCNEIGEKFRHGWCFADSGLWGPCAHICAEIYMVSS